MKLTKMKTILAVALCAMFVFGESNTVYAYNGTKAAKYATQHAETYNSKYARYSSDCTNFVSQCIRDGGKTHTVPASGLTSRYRGNITETTSYWYYRGNASTYAASTSWLRCSGGNGTFLGFWKKYCKFSTYADVSTAISKCRVGDVIQLLDSNYKIRHSIICVKKANGTAYCASHTKDYKCKSLKKIESEIRKSYVSVKFLVYHFA